MRLSLLLLVAWGGLLGAIWWWSQRDDRREADVIVVLGAAQYDGRPSPVLKARLDHALALWDAGLAPRLLFTGGRREGDAWSEAQAGRRYAMRHGVAPEAIILETASRTTTASIQGASALLKPRGLTRVLLVSDPFHMLRLELLARANGLDPRVSPTTSSPIGASRERTRDYMLRESVAIPVDVLRALIGRVVPSANG
ncbi:MAG: YdcF family protein [Gemmatimonadaceae bacterium]|nr:YdcF family protein [Gemmatimonadaceae bacterium]